MYEIFEFMSKCPPPDFNLRNIVGINRSNQSIWSNSIVFDAIDECKSKRWQHEPCNV